MTDPQPARPLSTTGLLQGGARVFGHLVRLRAWCYRDGLFRTHRLPCTVISIGNITSGGTGKTPMTLYVAQLLKKNGYRLVILSRGYKGKAEKQGGIVSDGTQLLMSPEAAGDEPFMMARCLKNVPVLVGRNRVTSGRLAVSRFSPDIVLLDDGFQHRRLHRDINIVLLDSTRPLGNGFLLPRGSLREPPEALERADILVFTRWRDELADPAALLPRPVRTKPTFRSRRVPNIHQGINGGLDSIQKSEENKPSVLKGIRVFAFSAIADNADFHRLLTEQGCQIKGTAEFADHYAYSTQELENIGRSAVAAGAEILATTEKDHSKLPIGASWPLPLVALNVLPSFTGRKNNFDDFLKNAVKKIMGRV